jgi:hypothetical protein
VWASLSEEQHVILTLLLLLTPAKAQGLLELAWPAEPVRFHLEALIDTPRTMLYEGVDNLEARAGRHLIVGDVTCTGARLGKKWGVDCVLDKVTLQGVAVVPEDTETLTRILEDYQKRIQGKTVALKVHDDGRIIELDLRGVEKTDKRSGIILDNVRMLMRRLFAPLDLQLPKKGDAKGKPWKQKGSPLAFELLSRSGTAGGSRLEHEVSQAGELVQITSQGRGMVSAGSALEAGTGGMMKIETSGRGEWDTKRGILVWREVETSARYSVSAYSAGTRGVDYRYQGWASQVGTEGVLIHLPE